MGLPFSGLSNGAVMGNSDLHCFSKLISPGVYESYNQTYSQLKAQLQTDLSFPSIYTADGSISSDRTVTMGANNLNLATFGSVGIDVPVGSLIDKFEVNGTVRVSRLKAGVASFIGASVQNELGGFTRIKDGLHVGNNTSAFYNNGTALSPNFSVETDGGNYLYVRESTGILPGVDFNFIDSAFAPQLCIMNASQFKFQATGRFSIASAGTTPTLTDQGLFIQSTAIPIEFNLGTVLAAGMTTPPDAAMKIKSNGVEYYINLWLV